VLAARLAQREKYRHLVRVVRVAAVRFGRAGWWLAFTVVACLAGAATALPPPWSAVAVGLLLNSARSIGEGQGRRGPEVVG
jgi:hypothetical protein